MFSIFGKRKPAETPTEEAIQGPSDAPRQSNGDDFIFVERKTDTEPISSPIGGVSGMMYPPMPQSAFGPMPYPPAPALGPKPGAAQNVPVNYLQDIPFELSPQLSSKDGFNGTQSQIDHILALLTRQMSIDGLADEYTFSLERSVQNEC
ncbi:uncharacterized protein LOC117570135 [Drosophila albomicans]|uniref:Uncharacterized protein LOC117570135 n=1 Tax=Drosophila albomicans TaxID=7291 RepID=A0A6P8X8A8_DROAB|nr:uncharacterized protein LOC117570135 [Drosophila albomicans]